jgi:vacuolar protein sorting-associated protein 13A/C
MSAGEVSMLLRGPTMRIAATLGDLSLTDDSVLLVQEESFKKLLSVEGDDVVDFSYETFDPTDHGTFPGYSSPCCSRVSSRSTTRHPK